MRMPPLLADFIYNRICEIKCEKFLTRPTTFPKVGYGTNKYKPKKPTQPEREPEAWAFCVYGYSVRASEVSASSRSKSL